MALIILIFVFYYVPESRDKLGIFPEKSLSEAIVKYGVDDDDDMVNMIDNIQKTVGSFLIYNNNNKKPRYIWLQIFDRRSKQRKKNTHKKQPQNCSSTNPRLNRHSKPVGSQILDRLTVISMVLTELVFILLFRFDK